MPRRGPFTERFAGKTEQKKPVTLQLALVT
jgi:hypothetical protein